MILFEKIIFIIYLLGFLFTLITLPLERIYQKKINKISPKKYKDIYVLLPALKEQKIVSETIDWFSKIKYDGKIKFIIITSEKEDDYYRKNNIDEITTNQLVSKTLKKTKDKRFIHLHYPKIEGNKSSQLNYALDYIVKEIKNMNNVYISVFDFDSKPDLKTFNELNKVSILKNNPDAILQVPLCFKNVVEISQESKNILMLLYCLQHTIRSYAIEKMKILICSLTKIKIPQYFMGACMHLKLDTLLKNGKFPFVDDLTLGYRYSIQNLNFAYLPSDNYTLIYNSIFDYINSATLIFKGISTYLLEIMKIKKNLWGKFKMFIAGTLNLLIFAVVPFIIIIYYLIVIISNNYSLIFYLLLSTHFLWSIATCIIFYSKNIKNINKLNLFFAILISPIWQVFRPTGFLSYMKRKFISVIKKEKIEYRKTER